MSQISYGTITITDVTDIDNIQNYYLATSASSGVTTSTSGWTTAVQSMDSTKQYLWNYEQILGTGGVIINTTTPVIIGRYGQNGQNGQPGVSITSIDEYYKANNSSTNRPTSWNAVNVIDKPTAANKYLWNYQVIHYSNNTSEGSATEARIIGVYGDKGDKGEDGVSPTVSKTGNIVTITDAAGNTVTVSDGTNGTSYYTHIRYATSSAGANMTATPTSSTTYIGVYSGTSSTAPTTANSYTWSKYMGTDGISVTKVTPIYYLKTSSGSVPTAPSAGTAITSTSTGTGVWTTAIPTYVNGGTYYTSTQTYLSGGTSPVSSTAVIDQALTTANSNAYGAYNIATGINQHFWSIESDYATGIPAGSYITDSAIDTYKSSKTGGNLLTRSDGIWIRNGVQTLASLTGTALQFYNPSDSNHPLQLSIGANGTLQSGNFVYTSGTYADSGTKIDLTNGSIYTPGFRTDGSNTYIRGEINALSGKIGNNGSNYWTIGNNYNYDQTASAALISHGTAFIQLDTSNTWRLSTDRIHTAWNGTDSSAALMFPKDGNTYWDWGIHSPHQTNNVWKDKFVYARKYTNTTDDDFTNRDNLSNDIDDDLGFWKYQFYIDKNGSIYARNFYLLNEDGTPGSNIGGQDAVYLLKTGGTITGNLEVNGTLTKSNKNVAYLTATPTSGQILIADGTSGGIKTSGYTIAKSVPSNALFTDENVKSSEANTTKLWLVGSDTSGTRTGTLKYDSGVYITTTAGTIHATTFEGALSGTASRATADGDGNTIKTTYLKLSGGNVTGAVTFGSSVSADELTAGDLVVNGAASFTNNLQANTINGVTVGSSPKFTDTTYSSLSAASGGTAVSLVTTGEKYSWNNKQDKLTNPVTGTGTSGYLIKWTSTNTIDNGPALGTDTTKFLNNKGEWAVPPGGVTGVKGNSESSYRTGQVNLTAANIGLGNVENKSSATIRGELTASNVTTALGYTPNHNISLGFHNDYDRCVIALCKTSAANTGINSWSNGVLLRQRDNGLVPTKVAYVTFNGCYSTAYSAHYSLICNHENTSIDAHGTTEGFRACTFTYNNERYAGLEFYQVQASTFFYTQFGGTFTPFMVQYYNTNNNTVKNSEIDNSLVYGTNTLFRQSFDAQTITSHTVAKDVPSDAIFTDTWKALSTSQAGYVSQAPNDTSKFLRGDATWAAVTKSNVGLGNITNDKQIKGLSSGTTSGHLVTWGSDGYTVADSGIALAPSGSTLGIVSGIESNTDGKLVLTYANGTKSNPISVKIIGTEGSSVSYAEALTCGTKGSATVPVYFNSDGVPVEANTIPKLNNATTGGTFYAPTAGGTADTQALVGNGATTAPKWVNISPSISITAGTSSATPKINVTVLGRSGTAQSLTTASTSVYGATKLSSTSSSTEQGLAATPKLVYDSIAALDGNLNNTTPGAGKTLTAFSQTDGKISATFSNISITKSQISDFPTSMTPAAHTHDDRYYTETEIDNKFTALTNTTTQINYIKFYAGSFNAGKTYIGWIKIASFALGTNNYIGENSYDFGIYRGYNSPASESYNIKVNTGWGNASIVQLNGKVGTQIIEKFRLVRDNTNHVAYFEVYVNTTYATYQNNVNLRIQTWNGNELTLLNTVQTEEDSAFEIVSTLDLKPQGIVSNSNFYGNLIGNADTASAVAWNNITGKPINFITNTGALNTNGWKTLGGRTNQKSIAISYASSSPATWNSESFSASIVFGCNDTKGMVDVGYNSSIVTFGGGSVNGSTDNAPKWYFKLSGTSGQTYTFPSTSKTLVATDGTGASGNWGISITGNAATATTATTADKLTGFSSRSTSYSWGNQTGTGLTRMDTPAGGSIIFRDDNPASGQTSMLIDGTIYIKEGNTNVGDAIKSITRSGTTFTYTTLWGSTGTFTQQDSDTKNTAGSTNTDSALFLVGATSQAANPQTYSHDTVKINTTGQIISTGYEMTTSSSMSNAKCQMRYEDSLQAIVFSFA